MWVEQCFVMFWPHYFSLQLHIDIPLCSCSDVLPVTRFIYQLCDFYLLIYSCYCLVLCLVRLCVLEVTFIDYFCTCSCLHLVFKLRNKWKTKLATVVGMLCIFVTVYGSSDLHRIVS